MNVEAIAFLGVFLATVGSTSALYLAITFSPLRINRSYAPRYCGKVLHTVVGPADGVDGYSVYRARCPLPAGHGDDCALTMAQIKILGYVRPEF
jgi:hypothetical protein